MDTLYENIGGKIKNCAKWMFIIEAIGAIITGFVLLIDWGFEDGWWALFIIFFGPIVAWVGSWILYAFGELAEDVHAMRKKYYPKAEEKVDQEAEEKAKHEAEEKARREAEEKARREAKAKIAPTEIWTCSCGCRNNATDKRCSNCYRDYTPKK